MPNEQAVKINSYRDLRVWQKSVEFVTEVYRITKKFPPSEQFGLVSQLQRAAVSIPANIAEGYGRNTRKEYINFLRIAGGSLSELETLLTIAKNLAYISPLECSTLEKQLEEISKMLYGLRRGVSSSA